MAENKTRPTKVPLEKFLATVTPEGRREDAEVLDAMFRRITGRKPVMWGPSIVGYDSYHYRSPSGGAEGEWPAVGFSPRKASLTVYLMDGCGNHAKELARLGKHTSSVSNLLAPFTTSTLPGSNDSSRWDERSTLRPYDAADSAFALIAAIRCGSVTSRAYSSPGSALRNGTTDQESHPGASRMIMVARTCTSVTPVVLTSSATSPSLIPPPAITTIRPAARRTSSAISSRPSQARAR